MTTRRWALLSLLRRRDTNEARVSGKRTSTPSKWISTSAYSSVPRTQPSPRQRCVPRLGPLVLAGITIAFLCAVFPAHGYADVSQSQAIVNAAQAMENAAYPYCFDGGTIQGPTVGTTDPHPDPGYYSNCSQIGKVGFDCTGLTLYAVYQGTGNAGLSHDGSQAKSGAGQVIGNEADLQPGDIVYFDYTPSNGLNYIDHAGIYVGNGNVLSAVSEKWGVRTESISWYEAGGLHFVGGVRFWTDSTQPPPAPPGTQANLLTNGGFEAGGQGWQMMSPGSGVGSDVAYTSSSTHPAHDGAQSLEANWSTAGGSLYQNVPVNMTTGQSATFSMWLKMGDGAPSGGVVSLCLWALSGGNQNACETKALTGQWQQLQATATMPAATGTLSAQIYIPPGVNIDFDGGVLTNNLLIDGGFEAGGQGWQMMSPGSGVGSDVAYTSSSTHPAHDGAQSLEANWSTAGGSLYQNVPVNMTTGQSATFSMWLKMGDGAPSGGVVSLCLWALSGGNQNACETKALTGQWQQLQATATMPAATGTLRAQIYIPPGVNIDFDGGSLGAPQTADAVYPPVQTVKPTVTGNTAVGSALNCSTGGWAGDPDQPTSFSYSWQRDTTTISGAGAWTYTITQADVGHRITCATTAANAAGSTTATSSAVGPVTAAGSTITTASTGTSKRSECVVPNLHHLTLRSAQRTLTKAHCKLGKIRQPKHLQHHHVLRVTGQSAKPGTKHQPNYKINVSAR